MTTSTPSPYHRPTCAASCSDFVAKSEDEATLVRRWYGPGAALNGCRPLCLFWYEPSVKVPNGFNLYRGLFPFLQVVLIRRSIYVRS